MSLVCLFIEEEMGMEGKIPRVRKRSSLLSKRAKGKEKKFYAIENRKKIAS
jgi:hypothetical protein